MIPYIINVALILAGCLVFYKLLLRKETFYRSNRYFLAICLFISFSLPLLPIAPQWSLRKKETVTEQHSPTVIPVQTTQQYKTQPVQQSTTPAPTVSNKPSSSLSSIDFSQYMVWLGWLYWFGVIVFGANFLLQMIVLIRKAFRNPVIIDGPYRIVEVSGDKAPCSFGNTIFINPEKYDWDTYNQILLHEKVHVRQNHSMDILLAELVLIFQWFNPFAWIYRRQVENNLEFLTDNELTQTEKVEKSSYQLSLLKVSVPHFPLSLTTNYNQSILKTRIAMMNTKRSNMHTAWKYFFLLPVLAFLACLLNEPMAQTNKNKDLSAKVHHSISNEGYWFAVIKDDKVNIRFSDEDLSGKGDDFEKGHSYSGNTFKLSELGSIPRGAEGKFSITREAGTMDMNGKFEGNTGMGRYKFKPDESFVSYMNTELKEKLDEEDQLAFWFIDVKKSYLQMLRNEGYANVKKDDLIPMAALHIDETYIKSIKDNGFKDISMEDLVPLKALGVDANYIKEIRDAGYKNVTSEQLVTFKSQGIDKDYISKVKKMKGKDGKEEADADDIVTYKALNITEEFANSFKAVGYSNIKHEDLVSLKSMNVTPEFIKSFQNMGYKDMNIEKIVAFKALGITPEFIRSYEAMGYKDIDADDLAALKSLDITPEYIKSLQAMGYKNIKLDNLSGLKSTGVTPEYIKSFEAIGYKNIDIEDLTGLKALNVTPEFIKGFEDIGFKNVPLEDFTGIKAVGVTPEYVKSMRAKGFDYDKLSKYVTLKSID